MLRHAKARDKVDAPFGLSFVSVWMVLPGLHSNLDLLVSLHPNFPGFLSFPPQILDFVAFLDVVDQQIQPLTLTVDLNRPCQSSLAEECRG